MKIIKLNARICWVNERDKMPNHITNRLTIENGDNKNLKFLINKEGEIDFNLIIPTPKCLEDFSPHMGITGRAKSLLGLYINPEEISDDITGMTERLSLSGALRDLYTPIKEEDIPLVFQAVKNHQECGYMYWYDWAPDNWGTKWNAYDAKITDSELKFETAWACPVKVLQALSALVSGTIFVVHYADEDLGSNCGVIKFKAGDILESTLEFRWDELSEKQKVEKRKFAFETIYPGEHPSTYDMDDNFNYIDD